ncbi:Hypothetical protein AT6N2_L2190 [Agrobacterium tumefaciens]|nr:Hypothetical protein AT6N2_L2190 [Agrobacterium tumefaciens]
MSLAARKGRQFSSVVSRGLGQRNIEFGRIALPGTFLEKAERRGADQPFLMHEKMLTHGFTGSGGITVGDGIDNGHMLFERRPAICAAAPGKLPYRLPGIVLTDAVDDIENRQKQLVAGALGNLAMERTVPQLLCIRIRALPRFLHQCTHAFNFRGLGSHRCELGKLRLNAQTDLHDFHEIRSRDEFGYLGGPIVGLFADESPRTLTPPNQTLSLQNFQSPPNGTAADIETFGKSPFRR